MSSSFAIQYDESISQYEVKRKQGFPQFDPNLVGLQSLALPADFSLMSLYMRGGMVTPIADIRPGEGIEGLPDSSLSTDTYVNSFYERYWREFTTVDAVCLEVIIEGRMAVAIERTSEAVGRTTAAYRTIGSSNSVTRHTIEVEPPHVLSPTFFGRLFAIFRPLGGAAKFIAGRWATPTKPHNAPKIGVVMCTFNKPNDVIRNLKAVADAVNDAPELIRFRIVDQGTAKVVAAPGYDVLMRDASLNGWIEIIEQGNFGGAGGFTRGMLETFADPDATHVLLMDDDVIIEPSVFGRLISFLKFLRTDVVVGGCMLDLYHRTVLHAAGERLNVGGWTEPVGSYDYDLSPEGACDRFNKVETGSYNAWWFCCVPRSAVESHGLPLPVFIRCDDAEFGTRLTSRGFPLVTLPSIFIWHEPFPAKSVAWLKYYDVRNTCIAVALLAERPQRRQHVDILRYFYIVLCSCRFDHALAIVMAIEDFCKGADYLFSRTIQRHVSITQKLSEMRPEVAKVNGGVVRRDLNIGLKGSRLRRLLSNALWVYWTAPGRSAKARAPEVVELTAFSPFHAHGRPALDVYNKFSGERIELRPNPSVARRLTWRMLKASWTWWRKRHVLRRDYREAFSTVTTVGAWCDYLGLDPANYAAISDNATKSSL